MKLRDLMTRSPVGISADASLSDAAIQMAEHDTGFLPVNDDSRAIGVITDRDIVVRGIAQGGDPRRTLVKTVMSPGAASALESDEANDAVKLMKENQIRRLLVLNEENRVSGIVSLADLAREADTAELTGRVLHEVSKPTESLV